MKERFAPAFGVGGGLRRIERLLSGLLRTRYDGSHPPALGLHEVRFVLLVVLPDFRKRNLSCSNNTLTRFGQHGVPQNLPLELLHLRLLVEPAPLRLLGQELHVDHLLQKLATLFFGLISKAIQFVHSLKRARKVPERHDVVPDASHRPLGLLRCQPRHAGCLLGRPFRGCPACENHTKKRGQELSERAFHAVPSSTKPAAPRSPLVIASPRWFGYGMPVPSEYDSLVPPPVDPTMKYRRIVLKLSGEALCGSDGGFGIDLATLKAIAGEITELRNLGVQVGVVVGGGNIFRGLKGASAGMDRSQSDHMGMLATVINALALQDALEKAGTPTRVMTAIEIQRVAEAYIRRRAMRHLDKGYVVVFAAGTGNPFFSTDTAAALRAMEIQAEALLKATKVEGIYDRDPQRHDDAQMFSVLSYDRFLADRIGVMDSTAVTLCRENKMPILVFKLATRGNILRVCRGEKLGTIVSGS